MLSRLKQFARSARRMSGVISLPSKLEEIHQVYSSRLKHQSNINQPLALITQVQRSGGTLLSQLFDDHPACHVHPFELYIGRPEKWHWPQLDLSAAPSTWFASLFEEPHLDLFRDGYTKFVISEDRKEYGHEFLFLPRLQRELFLGSVERRKPKTQREVLDCYFSSYFDAWLDYRGRTDEKTHVVAFVPRINMHRQSVKGFFADYPDGVIVSLIRDPFSWYASAKRYNSKVYADVNDAIGLWLDSAEGTFSAYHEYGKSRVYPMVFEDLLQNTAREMEALARFLRVAFVPSLLKPTFQGAAILSDSSFADRDFGVQKAPLSRSSHLSDDEREVISKRAQHLYQEKVHAIRAMRSYFSNLPCSPQPPNT
jgi:hypothetical protein